MDEYLFILLAKLKADRFRLAREQCRAAPGQQDLFEQPRVATSYRLPHRLLRRLAGGAMAFVRTRAAATNLKERVMKTVIALAASMIVNAGVLGALEHNVYVAHTPEGHVYVTELGASQAMSAYAQADSRSRSRSL